MEFPSSIYFTVFLPGLGHGMITPATSWWNVCLYIISLKWDYNTVIIVKRAIPVGILDVTWFKLAKLWWYQDISMKKRMGFVFRPSDRALLLTWDLQNLKTWSQHNRMLLPELVYSRVWEHCLRAFPSRIVSFSVPGRVIGVELWSSPLPWQTSCTVYGCKCMSLMASDPSSRLCSTQWICWCTTRPSSPRHSSPWMKTWRMSCILTRLVAGLRRLTRGIPEYWQTCSSRKKKVIGVINF